MAIIKCKMCGGNLNVEDGTTVCECEYCGTKQTVPMLDNEKKLTLFNRAGRLLRNCEFDKAYGVFENIVAEFPEEAEAYWGLCLCKYGIEYVDDPATGKKIPTCHRTVLSSIMDDSDFDMACENADGVAKRLYREEAKAIDKIQQEILRIVETEEPYDVFICYKELDDNGARTEDSVLAQEIYDGLTAKGLKTFFSRITLESKLGEEYEPYIYAALHSAKVMLAVGTSFEYFDAVWVKNEWSRFLNMMKTDSSKKLIPCFKGIDAYDMPREFKNFLAQDMGKLGWQQDLTRGVVKLVGFKITDFSQPVQQVIQQTVVQGGPNKEALLQRGNMALEDSDWEKAKEFFDQVLNMDAKCGEAYLGLAMAEAEKSSRDSYAQIYTRPDSMLRENTNVARARQFNHELDKWYAELDENARLKTEAMRVVQEEKEKAERIAREELEREQKEKEKEARTKRERYLISEVARASAQISEPDQNLEEQLTNAKSRAAELDRVYNSFELVQKQLSRISIEIQEITERKTQLEKRKNALGLFSAKEKKRIDEELIDLTKKQDGKEKVFASLQTEQSGFSDIKEVKKACDEADKEIQLLEKRIIERNNKSEEGMTYEKARDLLQNDNRIFKAVIQNEIKNKVLLVYESLSESLQFGQYQQMSVGEKTPIEWVVLKKENNRVMLISKYALDCRQYSTSYTSATWETCSLRKWLNTTFLEDAFSKEEQKMIQTMIIRANKNPNYSTDPGNDTTDKVFLLSIQEVDRYFSSSANRQCKPTAYAKKQGCHVDSIMGTCWWWLRTPGRSFSEAAVVGNFGMVDAAGFCVDRGLEAVRPAIWIDLGL